MSLFDCTDGTVPNGDRASSTVASQALFLMNSDLVIQAAENLAGQLLTEFPDDAQKRIDALFRRALGRPATEEDVKRFEKTAAELSQQLSMEQVAEADRPKAVWTSLCQAVLMSNEFLYVR